MLDQQHELDALWDAILALDVYEPDRMPAADLTRLAVEIDRAVAALNAVSGRVLADAEAAGGRDDAVS